MASKRSWLLIVLFNQFPFHIHAFGLFTFAMTTNCRVAQRHLAETDMNVNSSRSHTIFRMVNSTTFGSIDFDSCFQECLRSCITSLPVSAVFDIIVVQPE